MEETFLTLATLAHFLEVWFFNFSFFFSLFVCFILFFLLFFLLFPAFYLPPLRVCLRSTTDILSFLFSPGQKDLLLGAVSKC